MKGGRGNRDEGRVREQREGGRRNYYVREQRRGSGEGSEAGEERGVVKNRRER